jgi:hypothetical protein
MSTQYQVLVSLFPFMISGSLEQIHAHAPITTVCDAIAHSTLYVVPSNQLLPPITYPAVAIKEVRILPQDPVVSVVANVSHAQPSSGAYHRC